MDEDTAAKRYWNVVRNIFSSTEGDDAQPVHAVHAVPRGVCPPRESVKASDLFIAALKNEGVKWVFGVPGEENLDFVESMRTQTDVKLVITRHEQAAGFMASTVGRLTGKVGVCLSTLGPGATNFSTSAAYAYLGAFPMLMITGQKPILKSKQASFQIVDIVEMSKPLTKFAKQIVNGGLIPSLVRESIRQAEEERPGAVLLELPEDIAGMQVHKEEASLYKIDKVRRPVAEEKAITAAVKMIRFAKHPLLVIGCGANRKLTSNMLRQFIDQTKIPFLDTQMGKGVVDERHPSYVGTAAISSSDYVHACINYSDLIIVVGHDVVEKPPFFMHHEDTTKVIHINYFTAQVDQVYFPQLEVVGDIGNAIWQLKEKLKEEPPLQWDLRYFNYVREEFAKNLLIGVDDTSCPLSPPRFVTDIRRAMPEDGILCLDNGLYKVWFARNYKAYQPNTLLLDNALATMGAGLPSAIAAKMVHPERTVVAVAGDGGFMMNSQDMATAVMLDLHIVVIVLNDNAYGMIKWKQAGMEFGDFGLDLQNPDFVKYAQSYGAHGYKIRSCEEFSTCLQHCITTHGVHLIELPITYAISDMLQVANLKTHLKENLKTPEEYLATAPPISASAEPADAKPRAFTEEEDPNCQEYPFYIGNRPEKPNTDLKVADKYTGKIAYRVALAHVNDIERAIELAVQAFPKIAALSSWQRKEILEHCVNAFKARFDDLARALCIEAGKPIKDSRGEVTRLIDTFTIAAEESTRIYGEWAPMDIAKRTDGFMSITKGFPIGPISMISPFNFPLNLAAHKIAPALAVGCPFVLKPASRTPIGALIIGEILSNAPHLPEGSFSILPCSRDGADLFTVDERFKVLSFTGSPSVGWPMKARAGKKRVVLELGGNAACIVEDVRKPEDIDVIVEKVIHGAFYQSGQSCISVQRLLVRQDLYEGLKEKLVAKVSCLKKGDPHDEDTFIGPLIAVSEAGRIQQWVDEAVSAGANLLCGGQRDGALYDATILENVPGNCSAYNDEAFGPLLCIESYTHFKGAVARVNDSVFGLQAGVFTHDMDKAFYAFEQLEVGGVVIGNVPSIRVDAQSYGGVKDSGFGREGVRYAMKDYMEERVMMMVNVGKEM
ncbi:unnamed protein product [Ostreobium quekettii]|uniref:NADP-dependent glyceraldehyde-3-phosphate dehydrogenase n=1 Tax=Ostreobium quekettii TaxID=121088 RepID=A0A8S1IN33_9CHLO|nr:unnamed protein product [Ostreobium quekettii]